MYSQQRSENPIRTRNSVSRANNPKVNLPTASRKSSLLSQYAKPIKSALLITLSVILLVSFVVGACCIEGSIKVGFTQDFQDTSKLYSTQNKLFTQYNDLVKVDILVHGKKDFVVQLPKNSTVKDAIESLSLNLDSNDIVNIDGNTKISSGMEIRIDRVEKQTHTATALVPFTTKIIESQTIPKGTRNVITPGVNGTTTETVTETYVNGELTERDVVTADSTVAPIEEVVELGVGGTYTDSNGRSYSYSYYLDVTATAYGTGTGITASGKAIDYGMIAVDPKVIPLGTKVYLTGSWGDMGVHSAEDTGGAIKGNKIDVFLGDDYNLLRQFGRRSMRIYILG